jgi:hypothetical protein
MKSIGIYLTALLFLFQLSLAAQTTTSRKTMSEGVYEAIVLQVPGLNEKEVSNLWIDYTKDFYSVRTKYNRKTKEYFSDDADIPGIGKGNTVDIYTSIQEKGDGSEVSVWINLGGAYLSVAEHGDRYLEAEAMMMRFALEASKEKVRMDIKNQEKGLDDMMGELKKMENDKSRLERDIEKAKEEIARAEQEILENLAAQEAKQKEIEAQEELINETKKKLKDL